MLFAIARCRLVAVCQYSWDAIQSTEHVGRSNGSVALGHSPRHGRSSAGGARCAAHSAEVVLDLLGHLAAAEAATTAAAAAAATTTTTTTTTTAEGSFCVG